MKYRYNSPPNWPTPPSGWEPSDDWRPDTSWGPAPPDWQFWVPIEGDQVTERLDVLHVGEFLARGAGKNPSVPVGSQPADVKPHAKASRTNLIITIVVVMALLAVGAYFLHRVSASSNPSTPGATPTASTSQTSKPAPTSTTSSPSESASVSAAASPNTSRSNSAASSNASASSATSATSDSSATPNATTLIVSRDQTDYAGRLGTVYPETAREASSSLGTVNVSLLKAEWVRDAKKTFPDSPAPTNELLVVTMQFSGVNGTYLPNPNDFKLIDVAGEQFNHVSVYPLKQPIIPVAINNGTTGYGQVAFDVPSGAVDMVFSMHSARPVQWHLTL